MITRPEMDKILTEVNQILSSYDARIKALEEAAKPKTTTSKSTSQEKS